MVQRVLVTGTGGTGLGAAILQALDYAPGRYETVAADADPFSWGLYTASRSALLPWADDPGYLAALRDLIARTGAEAVIPGTEAETVLMAAHRDSLGATVIANDTTLMPLMRDKRLARQKLAELGLPWVPHFMWQRRHEAAEEFGFPLVVKPGRESSGSRGVFLVTSGAQLEALAPLVTRYSVVQPYLGDCDHEYSVMVLSHPDGGVIDSLVIRRQLTGFSLLASTMHEGEHLAVSTGYTQGHIIRDPFIQGFAEDLAKTLDSAGPLDLQLRIHKGEPHVFEVQPRFSFSSPIRAAAGFNEPDTLLRAFTSGERFGRLGWRDGVTAIRAFSHILVPTRDLL